MSTDRILTTHVGSLPRSQAVTDVLFAREREEARDVLQDDAVIAQAVAEVVCRQVEVGIDIVSDGEMSKISYATYIARRLAGFGGEISPSALHRGGQRQGYRAAPGGHPQSHRGCRGGASRRLLHERRFARCDRALSA